MRCAGEDEYRDISEKAPFLRKTRISYIRKVLEAQGPLTRFRAIGEAILKRYEDGADIRNQMAHADIDFLGFGVTRFYELTPDRGGETLTERTFNFWPSELEKQAIQAARLSKVVQRLHYKMFGDQPLE